MAKLANSWACSQLIHCLHYLATFPTLLLRTVLLSSPVIPNRLGHIRGPQDIQREEHSMVENCEAHLPDQLCRESPGKEGVWWDVSVVWGPIFGQPAAF